MVNPQLQAALQALYHLTDPSVKAQANDWLDQWQQSQDAWQGAHEVLQAPDAGLEAHYFAAQTLRTKVQRDYEELPGAAALSLRDSLLALLTRYAQGSPPVRTQLALALVALSIRLPAGPGDGNVLLTEALGMLPSMPALAVEMLTAVSDEAYDMQRGRGEALKNAVRPRLHEVLSSLSALIAQHIEHPEHAQLVTAAAQCVDAWLHFGAEQEEGSRMVSAGEFHARQPQLFTLMVAAVISEECSPSVVHAATDVLVAVVGSNCYSEDEALDAPPCRELFAALASLQPRIATIPEANAEGVAKLGATVAEACPRSCTGEIPFAVEVSAVMLGCLARPERAIAEAVVDYFVHVSCVPLQERLPQLGRPLYEAAMERVVPHASYPPAFTTWDAASGDLDAESFGRFRDSVLTELLELSYGMLHSSYVQRALQVLVGAGSWQAAEAALFLFSAVALPVRTRALFAHIYDVQHVADAEETRQLLAALFTRLCAPEAAADMLHTHPALARAVCGLIENYAAWFEKAEDAPLPAAVRCLVVALAVPSVGPTAAKAFQAICLRCTPRLSDAAIVAPLATAIHAAMAHPGQPGGLALEDKSALVGGVSRLLAALPAGDVAAAAEQFTHPFLDHAREVLAAGAPLSRQGQAAVAEALSLLAVTLHFLVPLPSVSSSSNGDATPVDDPVLTVLRSADGLLAAIGASPTWQHHVETMNALIEVYKYAAWGARGAAGAQLMPLLVERVNAVFLATALPSCLLVLGDVLERHFREGALVQLLLASLHAACEVAFPRLQGPGLRDQAELAAALLALTDAFAVYTPWAMWTNDGLAPLLALAAAAARLRESDPVRQGLSLIAHLIATHQRAADESCITTDHMNAVHDVLRAQGAALTEGLVHALCDTCPSQHMRAVADCIGSLLVHPALTHDAKGWVAAAVCPESRGQPAGPGVEAVLLEDRQQVCSLASGGLRGRRLTSLLVDLGQIARGTNERDVLLSYEL